MEIITPKFYSSIFKITYKTARTWIKDDKEQLNVKHLTRQRFESIYGSIPEKAVGKKYA